MKNRIIVCFLAMLCLLLCACGKSEEAIAVDALIEEIGEVTLDSDAKISAAESAFAQLEEKDVKKLDGAQTLRLAREKYDQLCEEKRIAEENQKIADVESVIANIGTVTLDSEKSIIAADIAFQALDEHLKQRVENRNEIEVSKTTLFNLRVKDIEDAIEDIGPVDSNSRRKIQKAEMVYSSYSNNVQSAVKNYDVLVAAKDELASILVKRTQDAIDAIGEVSLESKGLINEARKLYDSLTSEEKSKVSVNVLSEAEKEFAVIEEEAQKQAAIDKAKNTIRVTKFSCSRPNFVGGVDLYIQFTNKSDKAMKYVTFGYKFFNEVGDVVTSSLSISLSDISYGLCTGPFEPGKNYGSGKRFGPYYTHVNTTAELVSIEIEYMDGSSITLKDDLAKCTIY